MDTARLRHLQGISIVCRKRCVLTLLRGRFMPKSAAEASPMNSYCMSVAKDAGHETMWWRICSTLRHDAGVDANTVGRWERGITEPTAHHLRLLTTLYKRSIEELGYVSADRIPFWNIDSFSLPNPFFTAVRDFLEKLHSVPTLRDEHRKNFPVNSLCNNFHKCL